VAAPTGLGLSDAEEVVLLSSEDENVLTTALSRAIAVEDYELAGKLSARLKKLQGVGDELGAEILDWRALGMAEWLCDRAENLGFRYPTAVQRRASLAFFKKRDVVIQAQTGSGKTLAYLMPTIDNLDFVARKMLQVLIIVPSRELTIQTVMLAYRLFGGNVNVGVPGASDNMFNYKGPQGIKVVGVFEEDHETREGFADVAEIVVGTPDALARMKNAGFLEVDLAQTIIADEADQLFEQFPEAMETLLAPSPYAPVMEDRQVVLCGVSVPDSVVQLVQQRGHFKQNPLSIQMGTPGRVPPSVKHRRLVTPRARKLVALARQIRADLAFAGEDAPPPRTIVFVPSAVAAEAAAGPAAQVALGEAQARGAAPGRQRSGEGDAGFQKPENHTVAVHAGRRARSGHARRGLHLLAGRAFFVGVVPAPRGAVRAAGRDHHRGGHLGGDPGGGVGAGPDHG
jgi:hypothetical protein